MSMAAVLDYDSISRTICSVSIYIVDISTICYVNKTSTLTAGDIWQKIWELINY